MIRTVEALNYRCLRYIRQDLNRYQLLVGANASGKTTFLDIVDFLGDLVSEGLEESIGKRAQTWNDLVWKRKFGSFQLAIELRVPDEELTKLEKPEYSVVRYEVEVGLHEETNQLGILEEKLLLKAPQPEVSVKQRSLFPEQRTVPETIMTSTGASGKKTIVNKVRGGNDNFYAETGKGWDHAFKLGPRKSALANAPEDETKFPVTTWIKNLLSEGAQRLILNSLAMRNPSPPGQPKGFQPDGSNLPWVVDRLRNEESEAHKRWVKHVQTALPDIVDIDTVLREEDRKRYLRIHYSGGFKVPSWTASDGTLRLLALTLPAYLKSLKGVFLIEEPENGIHPQALQTVADSLRSVYDAQVLVATHSPILVALAKPEDILCFGKTAEGSTDVVQGTEHPKLSRWQRKTSLGDLFAAGVLS
jgi:predicted ATPase